MNKNTKVKLDRLLRLRLRKGWKAVMVAVVALFAFVGAFVYVNADAAPTIKINASTVVLNQNSEPWELEAVVTGIPEQDYDPGNITWYTSNNEVAVLLNGSIEAETTTGEKTSVKGKVAGKTRITATYTDDEGVRCTTTVTVITKASIKASVVGEPSITEINSHVFKVGDAIDFSVNTYSGNNLEVVDAATGEAVSDGVIEVDTSGSVSSGYLRTVRIKLIGGGVDDIIVRTSDGKDQADLSARYTIICDVEKKPVGLTHYMLNQDDYVDFEGEIIPTNVINPATAGVMFRSDDTNVAKFQNGKVYGVSAGVANVRFGVYGNKDQSGQEVVYTEKTLKVVVPYKKMGDKITTVNVGDKAVLHTSDDTKTNWSTNDKDIVKLDNNTGEFVALKAGTATITATRHNPNDELHTVYGQPYQLTYVITVIDGFGLSANNLSVNIDETISLDALVTSEDLEKYPVTFKIENQPGANGITTTEELVSCTQNGKSLLITGKKAGTVRITASQTVNGVTKSAICVVYVTSPVRDMYIDPSSIEIERGKEATVQLRFEPEMPTNNSVLWGTSNPEVATVTGDSYTATIKALKGGRANITVISQDGLKVANCEVYVREPVTGLTLNETSVNSTMAVGQFQLVASVLPAGDGVNRNVTWTSSNKDIITVDENGLVKFIKPGHATIICNVVDGGKNYQATCEFFISIPVEEIKLDTTQATLAIGDKLRLSAEVFPLNASDKTLYWESSNTNICVVDSNGLVQAVGAGACTILCKSADGGFTAMCEIFVKQPVTQIVLSTTDIVVRKGQVFWLNGTCLPENADNKQIIWTSRDENVCTVESDGKVTATGAGTTSIIATSVDSGVTAFCTVTVTQPVTGIKLNSDYQLMWVGAKYAIIPIIEPYDAENKNVTYLSSDPDVASVDENGIVTAHKGGTCIIEVTTEECKLTAACTIEVKEYVSSIELSETFKFMNIGASGTLTAKVGSETATNKELVWSSSNNEICSVDAKGNLIAYVPGTAVITATAADGSGVSATCIVRVVNPVTSITVEPSTLHLLVGESKILTAKVEPDDASIKDVEWISSDEKIAIVDEAGEVFALSPGKVKITAVSQDGNEVKGICWVYVTPVVNITSMKINSSEIYMLTGKSRQLSVIVRPAVNTDSYTWYSTDTGIVAVDQNGVVTTVGPGTANVFVDSTATGVNAECIVHSLALSKTSITLEQYDKYWLDVIGIDDDDKVTWRSSNPRVCTVNNKGEVVARKAGTTTITAVTHNKTMTCVVRVTNF